MAASFLGDLAMAEIIPFNNRIVGGMLLFGIAHILYIISYTKAARFLGGMLIDISFIIPAFLYGIIAVYAWFFHIRSSKISYSVNAASLVYSLWLSFMASTALQLAIKFGSRWWAAAAGAFLFVLSDFIIGVSMIGKTKFKSPEIFIWFTYLAGQAGIIYAPWISWQFF
jgi:YhhN-like protein.